MNQFRTTIRAFLIALLATALVIPIRRFVVVHLLGIDAPLMGFFFAVVAAAWLSGLKSGLFTTVLGSVAGTYAFVESSGQWVIPPFFQGRLVLFVAVSGLARYAVESLHLARQRLEDRQRELEQEVLRREQAEAALREQEERLRLAVEAADLGTWDFNPIAGEQQWSSRAKLM